MAYLFDKIGQENWVHGYKAVGHTEFSFEIKADKAIKPDQAVAMGLTLPKEPGTVWPVEMCNTKTDRHNERFPKAVLDVYAAQLNSTELTFKFLHAQGMGCGKTLKKASVDPQPDGSYSLNGFVWVIDTAPVPEMNMTINKAIETGIYKDVSVEVDNSMVMYVEGPNGGRGVWEYFIHETMPERTEIYALALVEKGAQRGASVSVKSVGQKENPKPLNMNHFIDVDVVCGKRFAFKSVLTGENITIEGLNELKAEANAQHKAATDAITAKDAAVAEKATIEAELKALRTPIETEILNLQTVLKEASPKTADELSKMKAADLHTLHKGLREKADGEGVDPKTILSETQKAVTSLKF